MASHDTSTQGGCEGCGREMAKAKRVHAGKRYCGTCYPRLFKRRTCHVCGDLARLPVFDQTAHCLACERAGPCVRCGKTEFDSGLRTQYGAVCKPCAPYFRAAEHCEVCGKLSQRLARSKSTGLRQCPKCSGPEQATCPSCRRYRVLIKGQDGIDRCEPCTSKPDHPCGSCGTLMPAGRGRECEECKWKSVFQNRLEMNSKGFSADCIAVLFTQFGDWLLDRAGAHKAALTINGHYRFFLALDASWGAVPSYERLLQHFGAGGLRKAENPMRFLTATGMVAVSAQLRDQHSEQRRLAAILMEPADSWSAQLLSEYVDALKVRMDKGGTDLRSVRLAARAAANLLKSAQLKFGALPTQKALESFWRGSPGQVAAVTGFLGHLNQRHGLKLQVKPDARWLSQARRQKAERELVAMLSEAVDDDFEARWIVKGLAYFHDVARASLKKLVFQPQEYRGVAGYNVAYEEKTLWVPSASSYQRGDYSG